VSLETASLTDANILLELNNAAVPDLNELTPGKAQWLVDHCVVPAMATLDGRVAGLVVVLSETCGFDSDYFRWFSERYQNFLYIDRVVVADWARGQGIARQLYEAIETAAREKGLALVADVYCEPPNTASLNLHYRMGFQEIGKQHFPAEKRIATKFMKYGELARPKADQTA